MKKDETGWFSVRKDVSLDTPYRFVLVDGSRVPDPASRYQPEGTSNSSLLQKTDFEFTTPWKGRPWEETVIYEIHIGTFTPEGTFAAAKEHLPRLAELGFTAVELMPLSQFPGSRGWGYDGIYHYAPHNAYGTPDDLRELVDHAHRCGLMVFLDVVYNHFGPEGNFLPLYAPEFFHADRPTPWGPKIAFEKEAVREYFVDNAIFWLNEFQLDGLRFDAVDQIEDPSEMHILREISTTVHATFPERYIHLMVENPANGTDLLDRQADGRHLYVADWNDDFHHAMHVAVTDEAEGHYAPFQYEPWRKMKEALASGYIREGRPILSRDPPPTASLPPTAFVHFLQNHDQVGNRALGDRLHMMVDERCLSVLTEILLLSPQIPLLFMGDDHLSQSRFHFFADYSGRLAEAIAGGRLQEANNFGGYPIGYGPEDIRDPNDRGTFERSKLNWQDARNVENRGWSKFLKQLIDVRRQVIVPLLALAEGDSGCVASSFGRHVFVDWRFGTKKLCLRANASEGVVSLEDGIGELVYPSPKEVVSGIVEPWTTHLYVNHSST